MSKKKTKKKKDPAYMVKQSDFRSHIDRVLKYDPNVQKAIEEEARRSNLEEAKRVSEDLDCLILLSLNEIFGFNKIRLMRFVKGLVRLRKYYAERYEDCDLYAMRQHLLERTGIDVSKLSEEVEKLAEEDTIEG